MISFRNDYGQGAHPRVMQALNETNLITTTGYGLDEYCIRAADAIKKEFACPAADVHFLPGGTITNLTAISAFLRPYEAVITAHSGHIAQHETGAIEATGHRLLSLQSEDGKATPEGVRAIFDAHVDEHMVIPRLLYISNSTEIGTVYTYAELSALRKTCDELNMLMYMDGARLGCALTSSASDVKKEQLAKLCDAFYIGGTKNGALFGEALVLVNDALKPNFRYALKQRGGMFAKGRLLGVQFCELFNKGLFFEIADHANKLGAALQSALIKGGVNIPNPSPTNQIFPVLENSIVEKLLKKYDFEIWHKLGDKSMVRFVTSWATTTDDVEAIINDLLF